ncbi:MAG: nucleoside triphosphate pyrophosphohydrolase [Sphingobacteriia bacterium]|jgi:XTP/dITP diphosphohydrolase
MDKKTIAVKHHTDYGQALPAFGRLLRILDELREHCPWDREQTLESIRHLSIEEVYELSDAILNQDYDELAGELGDVLLHVVFYARIADEQGRFDIGQVLHRICEKLIRRHPHIYADVEAASSDAVKANWEQIKQQEGKGKARGVLAGVPSGLPALVKAHRMQEKARGVGFDWPSKEGVWEKVEEELGEFRAAEQQGERAQMEAEFGDLLFSLINYARFVGINAEDALERTNRKFKQCFQQMEAQAELAQRSLKEYSLAELEALWQAAKQTEGA